ncbi:PREDICTED: uncharacterized protein LOC109153947 [Ipomoea nil]|uniref:uncharacterized protein LOC109153947 n=1 Tax=Ipomoea nil TaxID=35883 RepID=UPI000900D495|nr:PREDICTED: uncharacterized protein LOC109153947 [Ipomoea nil]
MVATKFEDEVPRERSSSRGCDEINEESSRVTKFTISKGELDNDEIHKMAKDGYDTYNKCMERVMKLKGQIKGNALESSSQCHISQDSQRLFGDSKVLKYVDKVVENFLAVKKLSESMHSFDLLTPDEELLHKQCEENNDRMVINYLIDFTTLLLQ